jgi:hypothetical protein
LLQLEQEDSCAADNLWSWLEPRMISMKSKEKRA